MTSYTNQHPSSSGLAAISVTPDIRIFYDVIPPLPVDPQRPILVLSNSLAATISLWDEFIAAFANTHTIVRYDARFHGASPLSRDADFDYTDGAKMEDLADDVIALLDHLKIHSPVGAFIGLSIGAGVGVVLASRYPLRFNRFVIVGTRLHSTPDDAKRFQQRIESINSRGVQAQAEQSVERWFGGEWIRANPNRSTAIVNMVASTSVQGFTASVGALQTLDLRGNIASIKEAGHGRKLLFVVGEKDAPLVQEETRWLAAEAGSEVIVVGGAGHIVNVEQPEKFHQVVRSYLRQSL
ncbi:hypothetical protein QQZ08_006133 [Neonectria magnoliae]|uniref:AB hydrolase-1 domain-containing protein n=1 Tax=Neonectria magnoliae TaxID=2732573 RepID=A0ABR1I282_9HYPO